MGIRVARLTISPLVPSIVDSFDVSYGSIGLVFTGIAVTYALTQFPSGLLGDRLGERRVVLTSLGLTAGCSVLLAMALGVCGYLRLIVGDSTPVTVLAVGLVGLGGGWSTPVQSRFMDNLSADEQATGFGLVRTTYEILSSGGAVAMGVLVEGIGWTSAFAVLASLLAVGAIAVGAVHART